MNDNNKTDLIAIKVTPDFKEKIGEKASEKGLGTSSYARMKLKEAV